MNLGKLFEETSPGIHYRQSSWLYSLQVAQAESLGYLWEFLMNKSREKAKATHLLITKNGVLASLLNFLKGFKF